MGKCIKFPELNKNNLYYIQNLLIAMEEFLVKEPRDTDYFCIDANYLTDKDAQNFLIGNIYQLCPGMKHLSPEECKNKQFGTIYTSSGSIPETQNMISSLDADRIVLVEDGLYDYIEKPIDFANRFYKNKRLYMFRPELASTYTRKNLRLRELPDMEAVFAEMVELYADSVCGLYETDPYTPVLFTSPLLEDYGIKVDINSMLKGIREMFGNNLIICRHPRDYLDYNTDILKVKVLPKTLIGQVVDRMFAGPKMYMYPSTVSFMSDAYEMFFLMVGDDPEYKEGFEKAYDSGLWADKSVTVLQLQTGNKIKEFPGK